MANTVVIDGLPKMDPERKAEWVAALRSGNYKQGHEWLNRGGAMCCLGVACDLHSKSPEGMKWTSKSGFDGPTTYGYDGQVAYPPDDVLKWLGFDIADLRTHFKTQEELRQKLAMPTNTTGMAHYVFANLNDNQKWTFEQIADFIEANF